MKLEGLTPGTQRRSSVKRSRRKNGSRSERLTPATLTRNLVEAQDLMCQKELLAELVSKAPELTGTHSAAISDHIFKQVNQAQVWPKTDDVQKGLVLAIQAIGEMEPRNLIEVMLVTQMIAAHEASLMFISRATAGNPDRETNDSNVLRAARLMRLFIEQVEARQRLKGKASHQKVTVEHVHVNQGGQAFVGSVDQTNIVVPSDTKVNGEK